PVPRGFVLPPQRGAAAAAAAARTHRGSARLDPTLFLTGGKGRAAAEETRHPGAGAFEAASLAGQRARARKPRAAAGGTLSAGRHHRLGDRWRTGAAGGRI